MITSKILLPVSPSVPVKLSEPVSVVVVSMEINLFIVCSPYLEQDAGVGASFLAITHVLLTSTYIEEKFAMGSINTPEEMACQDKNILKI